MKKVLLFGLVLGGFMMTSCKKDYTCTCDIQGSESTATYEGLKKSEADATKITCELNSACTWSVK